MNKKLIAALTICSGITMGMNAYAGSFTPGTYDATAVGRNGDVTLHVTFDENGITEITTDNEETAGIGVEAIDQMIETVVATQTIPDAVSGATISSSAFTKALEDAIKQAGGDVNDFASSEGTTEDVNDGEHTTDTAEKEYQTQADLIVVGGGAAGMTAAVTAAENGASVILIEKSGMLGGNTLAAANGVNAADSQIQLANDDYKAAGASVEGLEELQEQNEEARPELVEAFAENSGEVIDWIAAMGVDFEVNIQEDPRNPVQNYYMLQATADGSTGITMTKAVQNALDASDVTYYLNVDATELVQDENGAVTGVKAVDANGQKIEFDGKAVLLATGGFGHNQELLGEVNEKLANATTDEIAPTTGEGLEMAQAIGAKAVDLDQIQTFPVVMEGYGMVTPNKLPGGFGVNAVVVNEDAERFATEGFEMVDAVLAQKDGAAYMIFREDQIGEDMQKIIDAGFVASADTAKELGEALGLDGDKLQATVDAYNEDVADGTDDAFSKEDALPLEGKLYGFKYGVGAHYFMGGLLINAQTQVLDEDEQPIAGLYAAGEVTGGFHGTQRIDGSGIGDSFVFGRIAGYEIAENLK